jgi:single-strand DNA-binding protein
MNKQIAGGNLTKDAVVIESGERDMLSLTVACNGSGKDKEGNQYVEFVPVVIWGKRGYFNNVKPFLVKGTPVVATGKLVYPEANEKDGTVYDNALVEVSGLRDLKLIGGKAGTKSVEDGEPTPQPTPDQAAAADSAANAAAQSPAVDFDSFDDDIPFGL